jgi:hypothetical protein
VHCVDWHRQQTARLLLGRKGGQTDLTRARYRGPSLSIPIKCPTMGILGWNTGGSRVSTFVRKRREMRAAMAIASPRTLMVADTIAMMRASVQLRVEEGVDEGSNGNGSGSCYVYMLRRRLTREWSRSIVVAQALCVFVNCRWLLQISTLQTACGQTSRHVGFIRLAPPRPRRTRAARTGCRFLGVCPKIQDATARVYLHRYG